MSSGGRDAVALGVGAGELQRLRVVVGGEHLRAARSAGRARGAPPRSPARAPAPRAAARRGGSAPAPAPRARARPSRAAARRASNSASSISASAERGEEQLHREAAVREALGAGARSGRGGRPRGRSRVRSGQRRVPTGSLRRGLPAHVRSGIRLRALGARRAAWYSRTDAILGPVERMPRRGSFERRLLSALVLFSLVPSLLLIGVGTTCCRRRWRCTPRRRRGSGVAESGRALLERGGARAGTRRWRRPRRATGEELSRVAPAVGALGVPEPAGAARHPGGEPAAGGAAGVAGACARRAGSPASWRAPSASWWAGPGEVAREEPLPEPAAGRSAARAGSSGCCGEAFREHGARSWRVSRERALEAERTRTWMTMARSVAHELKNALTPLRWRVRALERQTEPASAPRASRWRWCGRVAARLEELARAFSQFGRLPEGPAERDRPARAARLPPAHPPPARGRAPAARPGGPAARAWATTTPSPAPSPTSSSTPPTPWARAGGTVTVKLARVGERGGGAGARQRPGHRPRSTWSASGSPTSPPSRAAPGWAWPSCARRSRRTAAAICRPQPPRGRRGVPGAAAGRSQLSAIGYPSQPSEPDGASARGAAQDRTPVPTDR